jgi:AraC-like DNA-binding protein
MEFRQIPPPTYLADYIRYFWVVESNDTDLSSTAFRTIADGSPGLIFQHRDKGILYQNDKELPGAILYGQATRHAELRISGRFNTIGIFFYPHALKSIFGLNADELTDTCIDLDLLPDEKGFHLSDRLSNVPSLQSQIDALCSFLLAQLTKNDRFADKRMQHALHRIQQANGNISVKTLREELQLSERCFERRFKQHIGVTPKLFARISQFQACMQLLRQSDYNKLSDIAFENEYADQSHFIRAFKEFAGFSPFQFRKRSKELIENLSIVTK